MSEQWIDEDENAREPTGEEMQAVGAFLKTWDAPTTQSDPAWLTTMLDEDHAIEQAERVQSLAEARAELGSRVRRLFTLGGLLVMAQVRYAANGWLIALASALVLCIGMVASLFTLTQSQAIGTAEARLAAGLPVTIGACIAAVIGVAFVFTEDDERLLELLAAMPLPPSVVFLARLLLVFGLNCAGALVASIALTGFGVPLLALISAWLLPMALLSALAFILSVWLRNGLFSIFVTVAAWVIVVTAMPRLSNIISIPSPAEGITMFSFSLPQIGVPLQVGLILMAVAAVGFTLRALDEDGGILQRSLD